MPDSFATPITKKNIPETAAGRIAELRSLPLKQKESFVPPVGMEFRMGPYIFRVSVTNPSQLRFSATLHDVIIEGVNDGKSPLIDPRTGDNMVKQ